MEVSINIPFFGFAIATFVVCALVSTVAQFATKGGSGKVKIAIILIIALIGSFLACHWDYFGVLTTEQFIKRSAIATTITMALFIGAMGFWAGQAIYNAIGKKDAPTQPKGIGAGPKQDVPEECEPAKPVQVVPSVPKPSSRFEGGKQLGDPEVCAAELDKIQAKGANGVLAALDSIDDRDFLNKVVAQWLGTTENALAIAGKFKGKAIVKPPVDEELEDFCCPDGCLHDLENRIQYVGADSDEFEGIITCKNCGYMYKVDNATYKFGKNCGYTYRASKETAKFNGGKKQVLRKPGSTQDGE